MSLHLEIIWPLLPSHLPFPLPLLTLVSLSLSPSPFSVCLLFFLSLSLSPSLFLSSSLSLFSSLSLSFCVFFLFFSSCVSGFFFVSVLLSSSLPLSPSFTSYILCRVHRLRVSRTLSVTTRSGLRLVRPLTHPPVNLDPDLCPSGWRGVSVRYSEGEEARDVWGTVPSEYSIPSETTRGTIDHVVIFLYCKLPGWKGSTWAAFYRGTGRRISSTRSPFIKTLYYWRYHKEPLY